MPKFFWAKVIGGIIIDLLSALFAASDIQQFLGLDTRWLIPIFFIIALAIFLWVIYDLKKTVYRLLNSRPSITVEPIRERGDTYLLKVTNNGELATFEAQIQLTNEDPCVFQLSGKTNYRACWDNVEKYQANIHKGHSASIKIAELYSSPPNFIIQTWHLFYCDNINRENYASTSSYVLGASYRQENESTIPAAPVYKYKLHIIISSNPSLIEGVFQQDYVISYERGFEQLTPNKAGSRPERA